MQQADLNERMYRRLDQEARKYIVSQLGQMRKKEAVATDVADKFGADYRMAQRLVEQIAQEETGTIHARRIPLIIFVSAVTLIAGLGMLVYGGQGIIAFLQGTALMISWWNIATAGTGIAMIVGSLIGLVSVFDSQTVK